MGGWKRRKRRSTGGRYNHPRTPKKKTYEENFDTIIQSLKSGSNDNRHLELQQQRRWEDKQEIYASDNLTRFEANQFADNGNNHLDDIKNDDGSPRSHFGGGGGGGATIIFKMPEDDPRPELLLIAAGGGGASDLPGDTTPSSAQGFLGYMHQLSMDDIRMKVKSFPDTDAGSGAGWNETLSPANNYSVTIKNFFREKPANPAGFSLGNTWMGGIRCQNDSQQFGGFGGAGAGCYGGGGGGGFVGGWGGEGTKGSGHGGYSYFNKDAVLLVLDRRSIDSRSFSASNRIPFSRPETWKWRGPGRVRILAAISTLACSRNCTEFGAECLSMDSEGSKVACVCTNDGSILGRHQTSCTNGEEHSLLPVVVYTRAKWMV